MLETLSLIENFLCTGDFEFEQKISPVLKTLSLSEKIPIGIFPCTGDFEFFSFAPCSGKKNVETGMGLVPINLILNRALCVIFLAKK